MIPKPLSNCECYANGLADRIPKNDLQAENKTATQAEGRTLSRGHKREGATKLPSPQLN
jgi:hypothetical protein